MVFFFFNQVKLSLFLRLPVRSLLVIVTNPSSESSEKSQRPSPSLTMLRLLFALVLSVSIPLTAPHGDHGDETPGSCEANPDVRFAVDYRPGIITVDGHADEWGEVEGFELDLLPALDPDADKAYAGGKMSIKAAHDGSLIFFLVQVDGEYAYSQGANQKCPSVALMFQIGENASYHNMGGCKEMPGACNNVNCRGHEVDIMHFSIANAIPGRLYGGSIADNPESSRGDRFAHLVDEYAWNPHCKYLDGKGPSGNSSFAQNDWHGSWWHSTIAFHSGLVEDDSPYSQGGDKGTYYFEFSRPLRTMDHSQQDVQFAIGQMNRVSAAFWYPTGGKPWSGSQHYSASCDWLPLNLMSPSSSFSYAASSKSSTWDAATAFALLLSVISLFFSVFLGFWVFFKNKAVPFSPIDQQ